MLTLNWQRDYWNNVERSGQIREEFSEINSGEFYWWECFPSNENIVFDLFGPELNQIVHVSSRINNHWMISMRLIINRSKKKYKVKQSKLKNGQLQWMRRNLDMLTNWVHLTWSKIFMSNMERRWKECRRCSSQEFSLKMFDKFLH